MNKYEKNIFDFHFGVYSKNSFISFLELKLIDWLFEVAGWPWKPQHPPVSTGEFLENTGVYMFFYDFDALGTKVEIWTFKVFLILHDIFNLKIHPRNNIFLSKRVNPAKLTFLISKQKRGGEGINFQGNTHPCKNWTYFSESYGYVLVKFTFMTIDRLNSKSSVQKMRLLKLCYCV